MVCESWSGRRPAPFRAGSRSPLGSGFTLARWDGGRFPARGRARARRLRFEVSFWQKYERLLRDARDRDVVVSVIFFIGGQVLPTPFAAYSADEERYYRYGVARLAAFSNVTWDLGNEHDFHREVPGWCDWLGPLVKAWDPYEHLTSAHNVIYRTPGATWNDLQLIQRWDAGQNAFMLGETAKQAASGRVIPQINEEYGYEDLWENHPGQRAADTRRRLAWEIACAGCYQTTGDDHGEPRGRRPRPLPRHLVQPAHRRSDRGWGGCASGLRHFNHPIGKGIGPCCCSRIPPPPIAPHQYRSPWVRVFEVQDPWLPLVELRLNEGIGSTTVNSGATTTAHPVANFIGQGVDWSTNAPPHGGQSALDFGANPGNRALELEGDRVSALQNLRSFTLSGWVNCRDATVGSGGNRILTAINHGGDGFDLVMLADGCLQLGVNEWPDGSPARGSPGQIPVDPTAAA